jgi:hypothetical protein
LQDRRVQRERRRRQHRTGVIEDRTRPWQRHLRLLRCLSACHREGGDGGDGKTAAHHRRDRFRWSAAKAIVALSPMKIDQILTTSGRPAYTRIISHQARFGRRDPVSGHCAGMPTYPSPASFPLGNQFTGNRVNSALCAPHATVPYPATVAIRGMLDRELFSGPATRLAVNYRQIAKRRRPGHHGRSHSRGFRP